MNLPVKIALGIGALAASSAAFVSSEPPENYKETPNVESPIELEIHNEPSVLPVSQPASKSLPKRSAENNSGACHSSYSGCLKANASDYDCAGGSGNGPYYTGKIQVVGPDVFDLDRNNDGWGCE